MKKLILICIMLVPMLIFGQSKKFAQVRLNTDSTDTELNIGSSTQYGGININYNGANTAGSAIVFEKSRTGATINNGDVVGGVVWLYDNGTIMDTAGFFLSKVYNVAERSVGLRIRCPGGESGLGDDDVSGLTVYRDSIGISDASPDYLFDCAGTGRFDDTLSVGEKVVIGGIPTAATAARLTVSGAINYQVRTDDVSNPPTDAELDAIFTSPASAGVGTTIYINDNNADANVYRVVSTGTSWWIDTLTKAL